MTLVDDGLATGGTARAALEALREAGAARVMEDAMADREQEIRERAHALWEQEGRPEGREEEHWRRASEEIKGQEREAGALERQGTAAAPEVGSASPLHPGGTAPGGGSGAGAGSLGTGGGATGGAPTGTPRRGG